MEPSQVFSTVQFHLTQKQEDDLIDLWETNEFLYNRTMEGYSSRQRREKCFDSIGRALGVPAAAVETHMRSLRTTYGRISKLYDKSGSAAVPKNLRHQYLLRRLAFLAPWIRGRATTSSQLKNTNKNRKSYIPERSRVDSSPEIEHRDDESEPRDLPDNLMDMDVQEPLAQEIQDVQDVHEVRATRSGRPSNARGKKSKRGRGGNGQGQGRPSTTPAPEVVRVGTTAAAPEPQPEVRPATPPPTTQDAPVPSTSGENINHRRRIQKRASGTPVGAGAQAQEIASRRLAVMERMAEAVSKPEDESELWARMLVQKIRRIENEETKEDFMQHVSSLALQAVRGTWSVQQGHSTAINRVIQRSQATPQPLAFTRSCTTSAADARITEINDDDYILQTLENINPTMSTFRRGSLFNFDRNANNGAGDA